MKNKLLTDVSRCYSLLKSRFIKIKSENKDKSSYKIKVLCMFVFKFMFSKISFDNKPSLFNALITAKHQLLINVITVYCEREKKVIQKDYIC